MTSTTTNVGELAGLARSFERHLRAAIRSPRTITPYSEAVGQLCGYLVERGMPIMAVGVHREHVEPFLIALHEAGRAPATVSIRFRALQQFFAYLAAEGCGLRVVDAEDVATAGSGAACPCAERK